MGTMKEPFDENQSGRNENEKCGNEWACGMGNCGWQKEPPPQFPYRSRNPILSRYFSTKNWIKKDREKKEMGR